MVSIYLPMLRNKQRKFFISSSRAYGQMKLILTNCK
jgi:hypothetical protein